MENGKKFLSGDRSLIKNFSQRFSTSGGAEINDGED